MSSEPCATPDSGCSAKGGHFRGDQAAQRFLGRPALGAFAAVVGLPWGGVADLHARHEAQAW
jgi:hypothetical protein